MNTQSQCIPVACPRHQPLTPEQMRAYLADVRRDLLSNDPERRADGLRLDERDVVADALPRSGAERRQGSRWCVWLCHAERTAGRAGGACIFARLAWTSTL